MDVRLRSEEDFCADEFFNRLQRLKSEGHLVDVTLCAEGKEIPCHRLVLSACSDYFHAMFGGAHSESKKDRIEIGGVTAEALQLLVDFAYLPKFNITSDNVHQQLEAANMLQVKPVEDACEKFLINNLSPDTCLGMWAFADKLSCVKLSAVARRHALKNFAEVCKTEEFLQLPVDLLKVYISDQGLQVKKEERVLDAVLLWGRHAFKQRQRHLKELLECVCFSYVDRDHLKNIVESDKMLAGVPGIKELIKDRSSHGKSRRIQQEDILLIGGNTGDRYDTPVVNCDIYRLDLHFDTLDKAPLPELLQNKEGSAACVLDNDVIVTGGYKSMSKVWRYKPSLNSWTSLASLKKGRKNHGMTVLNGEVYVVGGENRELLHDVEVYREKTNKWTKLAPLIQAVSRFGIAACCEKVYILGGESYEEYDRSRATNSVQCYDSTQKMWKFATPLPNALADIRACSVNSRIYLVGGGLWSLDSVLCYKPQEDLYEKMADKLDQWSNCSVTVCGSVIYITGGRKNVVWNNEVERFSTVQCYDTDSDTMVLGKDLPMPLCGHHIVTVPKQ
ncbi:kelch-like protein 24 [Branchiostoma floridae]|uniref:Kelch-like protein 24 n=1 Tax=Branchiostoma floridae TaxID=7739 RepID=A0A9J7L5D1_BRAFL|nr:kelch-like protein 24 [Branchiostoma floridae]